MVDQLLYSSIAVNGKRERVNNEFYVTMPYNLMIQDGLNVIHVPVENYMCLGTPKDVELVNYVNRNWK